MEFLVGGIRGTQYLFGRPARAGIAPIAKSLGFGAQIPTVDGNQKSGKNSSVEVGSLSHYLQGFHTSQVVGKGISEPSTVLQLLLVFPEIGMDMIFDNILTTGNLIMKHCW